MARHKSATKAAKQALRRQARNNSILSRCHTTTKKLKTALSNKAGKDSYLTLLNNCQSELMKAASKGILKSKQVSRTIGRLSIAVQKALK